jgi:hypothetical protein
MRRIDAYAATEDSRRLLGELAGRPADQSTRLALASAAVSKKLLPTLAQRGYVARLFRFSDHLDPLDDPASLSGRGAATHVGSAISAAMAGQRGRNVTEIVVVSDGRSNGGTAPLEAARAAASAGIQVHTLVVGDTHPERNLLVEMAESPPSVLEGDEIEITVRVLSRGTPGPTPARVLLEELDLSQGASARGSAGVPLGRPLAEEEVLVTDSGARVVLSLLPCPGARNPPNADSASASRPSRGRPCAMTTPSRSSCTSRLRRSAYSTSTPTLATSTGSSTRCSSAPTSTSRPSAS